VKYVDWVEQVLRATVEAFDATSNSSTNTQAIIRELGLDLDERAEPLHDALNDLERMGLLDVGTIWNIGVKHEARKIRTASLRTAWPQFHDIWLEPRQEAFLAKLCEMSERRDEHWAHLEPIHGDEVLATLGETPDRGDCIPLINTLADLGLVDKSGMTFGSFQAFPTYGGLVRGTEKVATEGQKLVRRLLEDWETTNVEFKRELHLGTRDEKAEFVRDVLALANTQVTGERYLVTGFDPKTHDFTTSADPRITQDTIENVLNEYTKPPPRVLYKTFPWTDGSGEVGLLEVARDRTKVPYRVSRRLAGERKTIEEGHVFVRHGSHIATASDEEIADLVAESQRARAE
jgi:hypothetical protein